MQIKNLKFLLLFTSITSADTYYGTISIVPEKHAIFRDTRPSNLFSKKPIYIKVKLKYYVEKTISGKEYFNGRVIYAYSGTEGWGQWDYFSYNWAKNFERETIIDLNSLKNEHGTFKRPGETIKIHRTDHLPKNSDNYDASTKSIIYEDVENTYILTLDKSFYSLTRLYFNFLKYDKKYTCEKITKFFKRIFTEK